MRPAFLTPSSGEMPSPSGLAVSIRRPCNIQDVDILIRRSDLEIVKTALTAIGFSYRHSAGMDMFLNGAGVKARDAIRLYFANEKVRAEYAEPMPDVAESERGINFQTISLTALMRM